MKKILIAIFSTVFLSLSIVGVFAVSPNAQANANEAKEEAAAARCTRITTKIDGIINRYEVRKQTHFRRYASVVAKLEKIISTYKAKGYDVTKLEADLVTLNAKIDDFGTVYNRYVVAIRSSKEYGCGTSEGQFRNRVMESKTYLNQTKAQASDIRNFIVNTIIPDIKALRPVETDTTEAED